MPMGGLVPAGRGSDRETRPLKGGPRFGARDGKPDNPPKVRPEVCLLREPARDTFVEHADLTGRGDRIRTCDLLLPKQALYQAELHPANRLPRPRRVRGVARAGERPCAGKGGHFAGTARARPVSGGGAGATASGGQ